MKFSAQEEYGLRCMLQLARVPAGGSLTIPEIGRLEGLSAPHVAKLLMILRREEFVQSTRGQAGGYALARPASEINVGGVLAALGGRLFDDEFCERHSGSNPICAHDFECTIRSVWQLVQGAVDRVLGQVSLADLVGAGYEPRGRALTQLPMAERA